MSEQQTEILANQRRPGALTIAKELQRKNPGWSWLKCCSRAKLEWEQKQRTSLPNTEGQRP